MNNENIFLYVFQTISGIIGIFTAYILLKYLNQKPLGMQTILDQMIKDLIYITILNWTSYVIMEIIVESNGPLTQQQ